MSDEVKTDAIKTKPARTGKGQFAKRKPMNARAGVIAGTDDALRPNESAFVRNVRQKASATWRDHSGDDKFALPDVAHAWLKDHGLIAQWVTETCIGAPVDEINTMRKGHWTDVPPNEIPGVEYVEHGGLRLMVRPRQVHAKAVAYEQNQAREVIRDHEQMVLGGNLPE